jgi:APA family basic amino acid/polyamine antiporter
MGEAAGKAGNAVWASFLLAGAAAFFTALSYAELSAKFPRAASGYNYTREAFGDGAAFVVGWLTFFSQVVSVSAVALGFGGYLRNRVDLPLTVGALALLAACTLLTLRGVKESTDLGAALSLLEALGLAIIVGTGLSYLGDANYLETPEGVWGVFGGAFLLFFAFLGFEQVADLAGEIKNPGRNLPLAVMASGGIAAGLYVMASIASVSVLGWEALNASGAPLASVAEEAVGELGYQALSIIALVATGSTVLIALTATIRTVYGMASGGSLPQFLARVHPRFSTPWTATVVVAVIAALGILSGDVGFVAEVTNFTILLVFAGVNISHMALRRRLQAEEWPFRVRISLLGAPLSSMLGLASSLLLLANARWESAMVGLGIAATAASIMLWRRQSERRGAKGSG